MANLEVIAGKPYVRLPYTEAVEILQKSKKDFEFPVSYGTDLQTEHERFLTEEHCQCPVIVYNYPKEIKPFYMRCNDDGKTVAAMDVLVPRVGELIGGSQREERLEVLERRIEECDMDKENYWWYLDMRRFGTVPHAGFGLGFERFLMMATGVTNIRDVIPFPRTPKHLEF
jgi:asparaginyl-tRNA synthetase